ncbi:hypothetical protein [Microbacterium sp. JZ31]|uniref:hypothetical protein n=1 Tax=Microbacterium sp. JZ31 TaxID=1906274 RepID=UPI001934A183|nr:hypothetical protein [Microbacterium sp. JZ31]
MSDVQTMVRTEVSVNGTSFFLAQGQSTSELKERIEGAAIAGGRFVDFTVVGNRSVSVLITSAAQVVFSTETVQFDDRDTGDEDHPYGGLYDF